MTQNMFETLRGEVTVFVMCASHFSTFVGVLVSVLLPYCPPAQDRNTHMNK